MKKSPYIEAKLYLEGLIVILDSLEGKEDNKMNIGVLNDVHGTIGELITKLQAMNGGRS